MDILEHLAVGILRDDKLECCVFRVALDENRPSSEEKLSYVRVVDVQEFEFALFVLIMFSPVWTKDRRSSDNACYVALDTHDSCIVSRQVDEGWRMSCHHHLPLFRLRQLIECFASFTNCIRVQTKFR